MLYVQQPPKPFGDGTARVWKLNKTLYGLKQAAREWHVALIAALDEVGFTTASADSGLYISKVGRCFVFIWVDDLFIASSPAGLHDVVNPILKKFKGKNLGPVAWALGCEVIRDRCYNSSLRSMTAHAMQTDQGVHCHTSGYGGFLEGITSWTV